MRRSHQIACYVNDEELAQLHSLAAARRVTLSRYLKECMMGDAATQPYSQAQSSDSQNCALEALLDETERRLTLQCAAINEKGVREVLSRLTLLVTMLDQFARTVLIHTPEIPAEQREQAGASGERRHRNWRRIVSELVSELNSNDCGDFERPFAAQQIAEGER